MVWLAVLALCFILFCGLLVLTAVIVGGRRQIIDNDGCRDDNQLHSLLI